MSAGTPLDGYLSAELETERCKVIPTITNQRSDGISLGFDLWQIMSMLPSRLERVQLASSMAITELPGPTWALGTLLLRDSEQDVVGNTINAMTRAQVRSFAHRAFHYLQSPERPQRILYCLARYSEEAHDSRIAEQLAPTLASDLSDAYLARSFNALYRHGIKSDSTLSVAHELVASHIDATNMDRKAAVSAITYLFFAGNKEHIAALRKIHDRVTIPELRRLLNWGFRSLHLLNKGNEEAETAPQAEEFWKENFNHIEPNYTGYGCFSSNELVDGLKKIAKSGGLPERHRLVERVLKLGDKSCIEWLAAHEKLVSSKDQDSQDDAQVLDLWRKYCPIGVDSFTTAVLNPENAHVWFKSSPELFPLLAGKSALKRTLNEFDQWLNKAENSETQLALNIYLGMLLAFEDAVCNGYIKKEQIDKEIGIVTEKLALVASHKSNSSLTYTTQIMACLIGNQLLDERVDALTRKLPTQIGWYDLAYVQLHNNSSSFISELLRRFEEQARQTENVDRDERALLVNTRTTALAILNSENTFDGKLKERITRFAQLAEILDPNKNIIALNQDSVDESSDSEEQENGAADWSGHTVVDRPIARWGAIIRALYEGQEVEIADAQSSEWLEVEKQLRESMRTAAHVEKRWILKSLANLGTDEAIKTLLYQGLQHIDSDFVSQTIRELLPSPHPRAQQALIRCVGRNAISDELKLNILEEISVHNSAEILQELKTLEILRLPQHIDDAVRDTVGRVAALLDEKDTTNAKELSSKVVRLGGSDVDSTIRGLLTGSELLNVDARSALRTAEMILLQSRGWTEGGMDLSPIVNMHCKAVELVLRDVFEPHTDALLRKGQLSRKLDILGYARPIPEKMQVFEDYLANLPVIKTIPYFSKFKLRKMLRGVCLYRPGKRFTLDGPKAFALFFLASSRKACNFGLENMLPLAFDTDVELFEYIKLIHSLQDSRNRAVHEGLTWEAKDEIEYMRAQAFKVIEISLRLKRDFDAKSNVGSIANLVGKELGAE